MGNILGHSAGNGPWCVHMGIYEPREHGAATGVFYFGCLESGGQFGRGTDGGDAAPLNRYCAVGYVTHPFPLHGQEVGMGDQDVRVFSHHPSFPFSLPLSRSRCHYTLGCQGMQAMTASADRVNPAPKLHCTLLAPELPAQFGIHPVTRQGPEREDLPA
jgi:hypothetical protein